MHGTITLGKFDGLHLGHRRLIEEVQKGPQPWRVLTFDPLPIQVLRPDLGVKRLLPKDDLQRTLPLLGVAHVIVIPFDLKRAQSRAIEFAEQEIWSKLRPKRIVVGFNFKFGHGGEGTTGWLKAWCDTKGIDLVVVEPFQMNGNVVSTGKIREMVIRGEVREAEKWLGRPYYVRGAIERGDGRGRALGFPTLNMNVENETWPAEGVYASRTIWEGESLNSVTNIGYSPTFKREKKLRCETYVLDQSLEAYGQTLNVELIDHIRAEKAFETPQDLKKQIDQDILKARQLLR